MCSVPWGGRHNVQDIDKQVDYVQVEGEGREYVLLGRDLYAVSAAYQHLGVHYQVLFGGN